MIILTTYVKKIARHIFLLRNINDYPTLEARQTFYNSYILPCFDYCATVWGYSSKNSLHRLYKYQKRIGRIILNDFTFNATEIFETLGWLTIYERRDFITLNQVYKCLYECFPVPLHCLFSFRNNQRQLPLLILEWTLTSWLVRRPLTSGAAYMRRRVTTAIFVIFSN